MMKMPFVAADHIIDIGPGAGIHGGAIIAEGTYEELANHADSLTGQYLSGKLKLKYQNNVPYHPPR